MRNKWISIKIIKKGSGIKCIVADRKLRLTSGGGWSRATTTVVRKLRDADYKSMGKRSAGGREGKGNVFH